MLPEVSQKFLHKIWQTLLIFVCLLLLLPSFQTFAQSDKINRIEKLNHYEDGCFDVIEVTAVTVGGTKNYIQDVNDLSKVKKVPYVRTHPSVGYRYPEDPDTLYFLNSSMSALWAMSNDSTPKLARKSDNYRQTQIGVDQNKRPVFRTNYTMGLNLCKFEQLTRNTFQGTSIRSTMPVKGWSLPDPGSPGQIQLVIFLDANAAKKGKGVRTLNLPIREVSQSAGFGEKFPNMADKAIPAGIMFALMFLALGLSGAAVSAGSGAAGSGNASDSKTGEDGISEEGEEHADSEEKLSAPQPYIWLNRKEIVIIEGSSAHPNLFAVVKNAKDDRSEWSFSVHPLPGLENAVADCSCQATSAQACNIKITAACLPEGAGRSINSDVQILAHNSKTGKTLETTLKVTSARKGLILVGTTPIRIAADGESESKIEITALTAFEGKLSTDFDLMQNLRFSDRLETSSEAAAKAFATAAPVFRTTGEDAGWFNLRGFEKNEPATYVFKVRTKRLLPGQGESYFATAWLCDNNGQKLLAVPLMLDVDLMQNQSRAWEIELERCRAIISRLPLQHQQRLLAMVERESTFLGAKGLYELRKQIWKAGQALWEAEGLSGYESVERWAGFIENSLNFAQWAGRMATDALIANKLKIGVFSAMAVGEIYDLVLSGIRAYQYDKTFDQWLEECFWEEIKEMFIDMGATALDPDKFVAKFGKNKKVVVIAWSVQFGYHFIANLTLHKLSVIDAAQKAAATVATASALKFLAHKMGDVAGKKGLTAENFDYTAAEIGWKDAKKKVAEFENALKTGNKQALRQKMLAIQSDKFALKEINKWPKEIRQSYNNEIGKMYASIDKRVKKKIIQDLRSQGIDVSNKDLNMTNATNAKNTIKVGSDRDISVEYSYVDKKGRQVTVEYPKEKLRDVYGRELYRTVGHKNAKNLAPDDLMEKYDQYALDSTDAEAYGLKRKKFMIQEIEGQKIVRVELENSDFAKAMNKNGLAPKFDDSLQIGMTVSYKGKHWFNKASDAIKAGNLVEGESFKMEGMSQLVKQYKNIYKPRRDLIDMMGKKQVDDSIMRKLIGMMEKAVNLEKSPTYVESLVKKSGFSSLNEFADAFGGRIATMNDML
ncbi:MAG: hypothetical protein Kow0029_20300 [Candidatus Rifleibacteriota bacterium]